MTTKKMTSKKELKLLRAALALDHTLFTVQRNASRSHYDNIRVDCFASKGADSPGLMRITNLVAGVLNYRRGVRGLAMNNRDDIECYLVAALSQKLELDLRHESVS